MVNSQSGAHYAARRDLCAGEEELLAAMASSRARIGKLRKLNKDPGPALALAGRMLQRAARERHDASAVHPGHPQKDSCPCRIAGLEQERENVFCAPHKKCLDIPADAPRIGFIAAHNN
jgi:hypothetical protein